MTKALFMEGMESTEMYPLSCLHLESLVHMIGQSNVDHTYGAWK